MMTMVLPVPPMRPKKKLKVPTYGEQVKYTWERVKETCTKYNFETRGQIKVHPFNHVGTKTDMIHFQREIDTELAAAGSII